MGHEGRRSVSNIWSFLKDDGWSLQREDGMQEEEAKSFPKFSPLSHTGQKRSGVVETGAFGKLIDQKPQDAGLGLGILVTVHQTPNQAGTLVS